MSCYRTCDIRGLYPSEVHEDVFRQIGRKIARQFVGSQAIVTGRDVRVSSASLHRALNQGLIEGGADVLDSGLLATPVIYFGKRHLGAFAAAIVTASHNPPEENGLKLLLGRYPADPAQIRALADSGSENVTRCHSGKHRHIDLAKPYLDDLSMRVSGESLKANCRTFVVDPGNGSWCDLLPDLISRLGIKVSSIHSFADGRFPARGPNCTVPESLCALTQTVRRQGAGAGIAWDGDGDRIAVCDEEGRVLSTDHLAMLLLPEIMGSLRRSKILVDVKMSKRLRSEIRRLGGIPVVERSGHCYLERRMIDDDCLFGCEYSGHLFFQDCGGADDAMRAALLVMNHVNRSGEPLSKQRMALPPLFISGDLRVREEEVDFSVVTARILERFSCCSIGRIDGLEVDLGECSFVVRRSISEKKLSFRFEADTPSQLAGLMTEVQTLLPEYRDGISAEFTRFQALQN